MLLLDGSNNKSGGDSFKKYLADQAKREVLNRSQDYLNENFSDSGDDFDFSDALDGGSIKDSLKSNLKKRAKKEIIGRSQDYLNKNLSDSGDDFDFSALDQGSSVKDVLKDNLKKRAKKELLQRSQDYLNEKNPFGEEGGGKFDFADNAGDKSLKQIFKDNAKDIAKDQLAKQGERLFDYAQEQNPRLGGLREAFYDPKNDDFSKRFAGIKGTNKEKIKKQVEQILDEEGKEALKKRIKKEIEQYLEKYGKRTATEEAQHLANKGLKYGVRRGVTKTAKTAVKTGIESAAKTGIKAGANVGAKVGATATAEVGLEAGAEFLGAAGAVETFGISEILAQLIVIAISLGISDAIDGAECLLKRDYKQAFHFFLRAATKIGVFILFIVITIISFAILNIFGLLIPVILIDLYWSLSAIPFVQDMALAQGLVWWEKLIIVLMNLLIIFAIGLYTLMGLYIWCNIGSLAGTTVGGPVGTVIGGVIDTATTAKGSYCEAFQKVGSSTGGSGGGQTGDGGGGQTGGQIPSGMVDAKTVVPDLVVEMRYATTNNFMNKVLYKAEGTPGNRCLLKSSVADNLKKAQTALAQKTPAGMKLKVLDCYRPVEVQQEMYDWGKPLGHVPKYIAEPGSGKHPKGEAIDLTIVDSSGKELSMPSDFDEFSSRAGGSNANSRILEQVMGAGGLSRIASEWWHFN